MEGTREEGLAWSGFLTTIVVAGAEEGTVVREALKLREREGEEGVVEVRAGTFLELDFGLEG